MFSKSIIAMLTALLFFVWIVPLGTFIKPEQEEAACNGQRAICLCTKLLYKALAKYGVQEPDSVVLHYQAGQSQNSSPRGQIDYLHGQYRTSPLNLASRALSTERLFLYDFIFLTKVDHILRRMS